MSEGISLASTLVFLGAATLCVPLASRFKLGSVLGYLAAGCLIGPSGLELVSDPKATLHFAEIGVVLMLFVIGLELDPKHLWTLRRPVFRGGGLQLVAAAIPIGLGAFALGIPWQGSLVVGLALGLSSTAVALQTMAERNLTNSPLGKTAFAVLLFQDIAAIPLLAVVPLLAAHEAGSEGSGFVAAARAFGAIAFVVVVGRYLTRPVLRSLVRTGLREMFTAFTLLLVLGIALLMSSVGVSMALGAFLAGVLLAGSEYRHALETDIQPFKGLLMGLFFIAVGMSIDFALLREKPGLVLGLLLGFQIVKAVSLRLVAPAIGVDSRQKWLFAALLSQGGEFAFVVFGVALDARLLPGDWDALLTLSVALSMALTPVFLILHDRFLAPKHAEPESDVVDVEDAQVIIAGFGRFGQIVGRLLFANGIRATVLDHDPDQIETLRRFDFKVYYGDATRIDLLEAAQAHRARLLVVAIDDVESSLRLVDAAREHFPDLTIVARARNVRHWYELRSRGVTLVERETFEGAITLGRKALQELGLGAYEARERADLFRRHNVQMLEEVLPHWHDEELRTNLARTARQQLERQMELDRKQLHSVVLGDWHGHRASLAETASSPRSSDEAPPEEPGASSGERLVDPIVDESIDDTDDRTPAERAPS